jgi:tRNA A37 methylthiotransferase MiaB
LGTSQLVLVTTPNKRDSTQWIGQSDKGHKVIFPNQPLPSSVDGDGACEEPRPGDYVEVKITQTSAASLQGIPLARTSLESFFSRISSPNADRIILQSISCG